MNRLLNVTFIVFCIGSIANDETTGPFTRGALLILVTQLLRLAIIRHRKVFSKNKLNGQKQ